VPSEGFFSRVFFHWLCPEGTDFAWYRNWDAILGFNPTTNQRMTTGYLAVLFRFLSYYFNQRRREGEEGGRDDYHPP
jgi:hypothetical protein